MVKLTDEQLSELDRTPGRRMTVVDPRSSIEYVLVLRADYERQEQHAAEAADLNRLSDSAACNLFQSLDREEAQNGTSW